MRLLFLIIIFPIIAMSQTLTPGGTMTGYNSAYNPLLDPNLKGWWKPDGRFAFQSSGGSNLVTTWFDSSTNNANMAQGSAGRRPWYNDLTLVNGYPSVRFNGIDRFLTNTSSIITQMVSGTNLPFTVIGVMNAVTTNASGYTWAWADNTSGTKVHGARGPIADITVALRSVNDLGNTVNIAQGTWPTNQFVVIAISYANGEVNFVVNNTYALVAGNPGTTTLNTFAMGARQTSGGGGSLEWNGTHVEMLVFNTNKSLPQLKMIAETYLKPKYGL